MISQIHTPTQLSSLSPARVLRVGLIVLAVASSIVILNPRAAFAANWNLHVVNSRSIPQVSIIRNESGDEVTRTDAFGNFVGSLPDESLFVSRGIYCGPDISLTTPEGCPGLSLSNAVVNGDGSKILYLPASEDRSVTNEISSAERYLVGRINQLRTSKDLEPLQISMTLSRASSANATYLNEHGCGSCTSKDFHYSNSSPFIRALDQGWPFVGWVGENAASGAAPETAYQMWLNSTGHYNLMVFAPGRYIGVGMVGSKTIINVDDGDCSGPVAVRCELTGDFGDPNLDYDGGNDGPGYRKPSLKRSNIKSRVKRGRKIKFNFTVLKGEGYVRISMRKGRSKAGVITRVKTDPITGTKTYSVKTTPRRTGRWKLTIRFLGKDDWADKTLVKRIRVVR